MKKIVLSGIATALALGLSPAANAAIFTPDDCNTGNFCVQGDAQAPGVDDFITGNIANFFQGAQSVDDTYLFRIDRNGVGSGGLQTSFSSGNTQLKITDLIINGVSYAASLAADGTGTVGNISGISIVSGALNSIRVIGEFAPTSPNGRANYTGNLTFTAAVPEASTWALMIFGVGAVGFAARRSRKTAVRVTYA